MNIKEKILGFLDETQCVSSSETDINQYLNQTIDFMQLFVLEFSKGKQIEEKTEKQFMSLIGESGSSKRKIISSCFPDYVWPENTEELVKKQESFILDSIKRQIDGILLSRDQKMARNMLPYFEKEGVFAAVGFGHLSGVLEELKAQAMR